MEPWPSGLGAVGEGARGARSRPRKDQKLLKFAKQMRSDATKSEARLWAVLRAKKLDGWKFKRQVPLGPFIADFVCFDARLVIEADGGQHSERESDDMRDRWFADNGFRVLRFWNNEIMDNMDGVVAALRQALTPSPTSPSTVPAQGFVSSPARGEEFDT